MKKNILIGQSGGPTAAINSSLCGIIAEGRKHPEEIDGICGMANGIEGYINGFPLIPLSELDEKELQLLMLTPSAYLGSCRYRIPEDFTAGFYPMLFKKLHNHNIGYFLYIGGNDSMDTVDKLSRYGAQTGSGIRFIGIPKTIDNDLTLTDHSPGYGSAAKYVAATVRDIVMDASVYHHPSVTIIELMGRHTGWLTAASVLARREEGDNPLLIYLPESDFDLGRFKNDLNKAFKKAKNIVVCVSEGISDSDGKFICEYGSEASRDTFGHKMLTGCGKVLENFVRSELQCKVRSIELNVCQRCCGMAASLTDIREASEAGAEGVRAALRGESGKMVSLKRISDRPYWLEFAEEDVFKICNSEKQFPKKWITGQGSDISPEFLTYLLPLVLGEVTHSFKNGVPEYLYRR